MRDLVLRELPYSGSNRSKMMMDALGRATRSQQKETVSRSPRGAPEKLL